MFILTKSLEIKILQENKLVITQIKIYWLLLIIIKLEIWQMDSSNCIMYNPWFEVNTIDGLVIPIPNNSYKQHERNSVLIPIDFIPMGK